MNKLKYTWSGLLFRMIAGTVFILLLLGSFVGFIGYIRFTHSLTDEYNDSAFRTADTAVRLIDGDRIDEWQAGGGQDADYIRTADNINTLCAAQNVTMIYVIDVDRSDYGRFKSVFNAVLENSGYEPWPIGYARDTTNDEYRTIYRDIYENGLKRGTVVRTDMLRGKKPHITSLVPVKRSDGTVRAILCVQRPMEELTVGRRLYITYVALVALLALIVSSFSIYFFLKVQFVYPMERIIGEASRFAKETGTDGGDRLDGISRIREINTLAESLMQMEADTERQIGEITRLTGEKERISAELDIAAKIQAEMLPKNLREISDGRNFSLYARMLPANEVGGDFYDYYMLDRELLAFVIGDVSGKGVPASLFMVLTKTLLKDNLIMTGSLKSAMKHTSNVLFENSGGDMFVTCFLAVLDTVSGELTYVNAGHNPPVITRKDGSCSYLEDSGHQLVLSGWPDYGYKEERIMLQPGDGILLYTDGVTEARNPAGDFFEADRLLSWVNGTGDKYEDAEEYVEALASYMDAFRGNAERSDDMTMLRLVLSRVK